MTSPKQVSFDDYLDLVFASPNWLDACVTMLAAFLESIDSHRDTLELSLSQTAPSIVDQVSAVVDGAKRLELQLRDIAERQSTRFEASELGAVLWWAGMALHNGNAAVESSRNKLARKAWEEAFYEVHVVMYETMASISLLSLAEGMIQSMETEPGDVRPN